jgi:hypothetical protein
MTSPEVTWHGNVTPHPSAPGGTVAESGFAHLYAEQNKFTAEAAQLSGQIITAQQVELEAVPFAF